MAPDTDFPLRRSGSALPGATWKASFIRGVTRLHNHDPTTTNVGIRGLNQLRATRPMNSACTILARMSTSGAPIGTRRTTTQFPRRAIPQDRKPSHGVLLAEACGGSTSRLHGVLRVPAFLLNSSTPTTDFA